METPTPRLVRDIREGFCEEEALKMILETTGQVWYKQRKQMQRLWISDIKKISKSSVAGLQTIEGESSEVRGRGQVPMTEQGRETLKGFLEGHTLLFSLTPDFPGGATGKEPPLPMQETEETGSVPGLGRSPGGGHGSPLQYSCLENPYGQRSLAGYSP